QAGELVGRPERGRRVDPELGPDLADTIGRVPGEDHDAEPLTAELFHRRHGFGTERLRELEARELSTAPLEDDRACRAAAEDERTPTGVDPEHTGAGDVS